ncbi:MAG: hypothetical protein MUO72_12890 [Bacteroidales bacterium]|nr:hypothetical protein [Bacteroidales bacterium]
MFDFTLTSYRSLTGSLIQQGFTFQTFEEFITKPAKRVIVLRNDVDKLPGNSLIFAKIQHELGLRGTYYFRVVKESWDEGIIKQIAGMGHEVGYHYEDLGATAQRLKGTTDKEEIVKIAIENFSKNLKRLRELAPVKTICMHGSPMSRWDSRLLWEYYDYRDYGIIGEPYFDVDFSSMLYLTDTGRSWRGGSVSVRDKGLGIRDKGLGEEVYKDWKVKPMSGSLMNMTPESINFQNRYKFMSTSEIIRAAKGGRLPGGMMITFHPQRWTDKPIPWLKELIWQNVKNEGKYFLVRMRDKELGIRYEGLGTRN